MLDLAHNKISGILESWNYYDLRKLTSVDLSDNKLTGGLDILFSPLIRKFNVSHNQFDRIAHTIKSRHALNTIESVDFSHNIINQDAVSTLQKLPPNLKELILSNNQIHGTLPEEFPVLSFMKRFIANDNQINGKLLNFPRSMPLVSEINLSNQKHNGGGLTGSIPTDLSR